MTITLANLSANLSTAATHLQFTCSFLNGRGTLTLHSFPTRRSSDLAIHAPLVNQGTMVVDGGSGIAGSFSAQSGSVLRVRAEGNTGEVQSRPRAVFGNNGTIELTSVNCGYQASLTVNGTLINPAEGS